MKRPGRLGWGWTGDMAPIGYVLGMILSRRAPTSRPRIDKRVIFRRTVAPLLFSITNVPRSLASAIGPTISGILNIIYDLTLLRMFQRVKPPEEQGRS
jgi:hypothetical protein